MSFAFHEAGLLLAEMLGYFGGMLALFRLRTRLGIGAFFAALCSLHFLETYVAASVYVQLTGGWSLTPGSVVLFSGKLMLILLVYIREDAAVARQPIYGLLLGNVMTLAVISLLRLHGAIDSQPDLHLLQNMGGLMVWGTMLLFVDSLVMILLYERLARVLRNAMFLRLWLTGTAVLSFDQAGFFAALHLMLDVPWSAGLGGWVGKIVAAGVYSAMATLYLQRFEARAPANQPRRELFDLFQILTYRQRYEALREVAAHDALTGLLQRGQFDPLGQPLIAAARRHHEPLSVLMIDVDRFKSINDRFGHPAGDEILREVAAQIRQTLRSSDYAFRYGGDEFAVLTPATSQAGALATAEKLRSRISSRIWPHIGEPITASVGVATMRSGDESLEALVARADRRLYEAKRSGRNQVCAEPNDPIVATG